MPQLSGGGGDPELCATDEMIPFKDEGDPQKEQIFAELSHSEEEGDLADIKSSLVNESEISPNSNSHDVMYSVISVWKFKCQTAFLQLFTLSLADKAARQSQIAPDSYHEKHRDHPDDGFELSHATCCCPPRDSLLPGYCSLTPRLQVIVGALQEKCASSLLLFHSLNVYPLKTKHWPSSHPCCHQPVYQEPGLPPHPALLHAAAAECCCIEASSMKLSLSGQRRRETVGASPILTHKGHPYQAYPGYIMMGNMNNDSYMNNGSLSPPMARTLQILMARMRRRE
ncbi:hypothetical protein GOODEAATRI_006196 [Goodea atripinnis]|uniref:CTNNB1 binding N-teminal domain-containing protein n=1 Tax=Goodea atripinnis TaxID=208336 RepID=A0ABV0MFG8_9TELE